MNKSVRGFALISTLLFLGILFMMSLSMVVMSRHRVFSGLTQHHKSQALYLAEAGLAKSQVALEADLDWAGEPATESQPNGTGQVDGIPGSYEVHFGTDRNGSVNNIGQSAAADSYRGEETVPPNTALLIVTATVSGHSYTLEALVRGKGSVGYMSDAILASGKIRAKGDLKIDGIAALDDAKEVDGSMQSNHTDGAETVVWEGGGTAVIAGNVGTGGASSGIKMPGAVIKGSLEANAPANIPHTDIVDEVTKNMGHGAPPPPGGASWSEAIGTATFSGGKYSLSDVDLQGDLVLADGATLYINGDLKINGSISGKGSVYVTGETSFRGDSKVTTNPDFSVALFSKGDVSLRGFDGTEFLASLGPDAQSYLLTASKALENLGEAAKLRNYTDMNNAASALGKHDVDPLDPRKVGDGKLDVWGGYEHPNSLGQLKTLVEGIPSKGPSKDYMVERLGALSDMFSSPDDIFAPDPATSFEAQAWDNFRAGSNAGFVDSVISAQATAYPLLPEEKVALWGSAKNLIHQTSFDKLGSSYFLGAIYTQGRFVAENEVTIVGALIADGDKNGALKKVTLNDGNTTLDMRPGDIYLGNRTSVTYVEEMFKDDDDVSYTGPQLLEKNIWMGR